MIFLKKNILFTFILLIFIAGCSDINASSKTEKNLFYYGEGDKWFSTLTITEVNASHFRSLYIQYINDREQSVDEQQNLDIGDIEFVLNLASSEWSSNNPHSLKGIGNFHTAIEINSELTNELPNEVTLTIRWKDNEEVILLKKQVES